MNPHKPEPTEVEVRDRIERQEQKAFENSEERREDTYQVAVIGYYGDRRVV